MFSGIGENDDVRIAVVRVKISRNTCDSGEAVGWEALILQGFAGEWAWNSGIQPLLSLTLAKAPEVLGRAEGVSGVIHFVHKLFTGARSGLTARARRLVLVPPFAKKNCHNWVN